MSVVNTALSVMAYDYPVEKLSVYLSDDGGSDLTLFAFMEAAKFAKHWIPFCRMNNIMMRSPKDYLDSKTTDGGNNQQEINSMKVSYRVVIISWYVGGKLKYNLRVYIKIS